MLGRIGQIRVLRESEGERERERERENMWAIPMVTVEDEGRQNNGGMLWGWECD